MEIKIPHCEICTQWGWCSYIITFLQLFSSSEQFYDRSRLPCPCRLESHKRNTYEPASASCSLCRSILPCRQVLRVTNIYVLSYYVCSPFSRYLLPEFWAVLLLRHLLPAVLLRDRYILLHRNQGNGQGTSRQRNSSDRYRSNSSSPHFTSLFFMESFRKSLWSSGRTGSWYPFAARMFSLKSTKCFSISIFWAISAGVSTSPCVYRNSCRSSWYFIAR